MWALICALQCWLAPSSFVSLPWHHLSHKTPETQVEPAQERMLLQTLYLRVTENQLRAPYSRTHNHIPGGKPYTSRTPALQQKHSLPPAQSTRNGRRTSQPIGTAVDFDFPAHRLWLVRPVPGGTRPRAVIGRFSRLCGSHLNTPSLWGCAAASHSVSGADQQWSRAGSRHTAETPKPVGFHPPCCLHH